MDNFVSWSHLSTKKTNYTDPHLKKSQWFDIKCTNNAYNVIVDFGQGRIEDLVGPRRFLAFE